MKIDRSSQLQHALEHIDGDPARLGEALDRVLEQTGATNAELQAALAASDRFTTDQRGALEALLGQRLARTVTPPSVGLRAHIVRANKHKPWFLAVADKPAIGPQLFPEPPRDVDVAGAKLTRDELARLLRGAG